MILYKGLLTLVTLETNDAAYCSGRYKRFPKNYEVTIQFIASFHRPLLMRGFPNSQAPCVMYHICKTGSMFRILLGYHPQAQPHCEHALLVPGRFSTCSRPNARRLGSLFIVVSFFTPLLAFPRAVRSSTGTTTCDTSRVAKSSPSSQD